MFVLSSLSPSGCGGYCGQQPICLCSDHDSLFFASSEVCSSSLQRWHQWLLFLNCRPDRILYAYFRSWLSTPGIIPPCKLDSIPIMNGISISSKLFCLFVLFLSTIGSRYALLEVVLSYGIVFFILPRFLSPVPLIRCPTKVTRVLSVLFSPRL